MSDKITIYIGQRLREARKLKNMTQADVAMHAKTTVNHYAKIERGEVVPSLKTLERIVKAMGVKSSDILPF